MIDLATVPFTVDGYRALLAYLLGQSYRALTFDAIAQPNAATGRSIVIRHDVELDLAAALITASVEHEFGIVATYFICPTSPFFNILSRNGRRLISQIAALGHQIGVHAELVSGKDLQIALPPIVRLLQHVIPEIRPNLISLHAPGPLHNIPLGAVPELSTVYSSLCNGTVKYLSDSMGSWPTTQSTNQAILGLDPRIHLLTHPAWWVHEGVMPSDKLDCVLEKLKAEARADIATFLPKFSRRYSIP